MVPAKASEHLNSAIDHSKAGECFGCWVGEVAKSLQKYPEFPRNLTGVI
jgi:hypothetical protein